MAFGEETVGPYESQSTSALLYEHTVVFAVDIIYIIVILSVLFVDTHTHCLTALVRDYPGEPVPER